jgi:hypothetical protein
MREQHIRHCPVGMTNEYRSSKTCVFCFQPVRLARSRRLVKGNIKLVKVHGAVECVNPDCISFRCGYTIKSRDPHAATCIALAGASTLFSSTLSPFTRVYRPQNTINASTSALEDPLPNPEYQFIDDTIGVPPGQGGL